MCDILEFGLGFLWRWGWGERRTWFVLCWSYNGCSLKICYFFLKMLLSVSHGKLTHQHIRAHYRCVSRRQSPQDWPTGRPLGKSLQAIFSTCKMGIIHCIFIILMFGGVFLGRIVLHMPCLPVFTQVDAHTHTHTHTHTTSAGTMSFYIEELAYI